MQKQRSSILLAYIYITTAIHSKIKIVQREKYIFEINVERKDCIVELPKLINIISIIQFIARHQSRTVLEQYKNNDFNEG